MLLRAAFLLLPLLALAQNQQPAQAPPPEVDSALRARVSEFLQYHVEGNFRKAYDLVAEDTKDYYFAANKIRLVDFKITQVDYSDNFTKAKVTSVITRMWRIHTDEEKVVVPMETNWKLENGKWFWYFDENANRQLMSMGPSDVESMRKSAEAGKMPDLSPEAIQARAQKILKSSSVDRTAVTMGLDRESVEKVVFHNGFPGWIMLSSSMTVPVPGLSATLKKTTLGSGEDTVLELHYKPEGDAPKTPTRVDLRVQPFEQVFSVEVTFGTKVTDSKH